MAEHAVDTWFIGKYNLDYLHGHVNSATCYSGQQRWPTAHPLFIYSVCNMWSPTLSKQRACLWDVL